jgi:predicted amidohydrolase
MRNSVRPLVHYTSGNHLSVFAIKGIRCSALICHDYRYPELYRDYKRRGIQLMFHSYHAAHVSASVRRLTGDAPCVAEEASPGSHR